MLGKLISLLFINDLPEHISTNNNNGLTLFADVTSLPFSEQRREGLTALTKELISCLLKWCNSDNVNLNTTKIFYFFSFNCPDKYSLSSDINGTELVTTNCKIFLGSSLGTLPRME